MRRQTDMKFLALGFKEQRRGKSPKSRSRASSQRDGYTYA